MNCKNYRGELIEMARGGTPTLGFAGHLATCISCRTRLDMQIGLTASMARAASENSRIVIPLGAESVLLAEFIRVRKPQVHVMRRWLPIAGLAAAAALVAAIVFGSGVARSPERSPTPELHATAAVTVPAPVESAPPVLQAAAPRPSHKPPAVTHAQPAAQDQDQDQPFIDVPYSMPLGQFERAEMMQMEMPVSALIAAGMPVGAADPMARAKTDVIVGQDGRAHAFRIISVSAIY